MAPPEPLPLSAEDKAGVEASTEAFLKAYRASDWAALAAMYTEDAVLLPPNGPAVVGRDNIQRSFDSGGPAGSIELETMEIEGFADLAYVRGTFRTTSAPEEGEPVTVSGKFLEIRRRQADGSWLYTRDMFNSSDPMPMAEPE
jgi:uncharacterized protein (TIGR02246 family)